MRVIGYTKFWEMVDAIDEYIDGNFSRAKYRGLMGDVFHYPRIRHEWLARPVVAIKAIILMRYQQDDVIVYVRPNECIRVNKSTTLESILAIIKSKYKGQNKKNGARD